MQDRLDNFMDRRGALALFDEPRSRDPEKPWPLLPILAFIAPGGSGKSTLINYLRATKCRATLPHAHIDFTVPGAPTDLPAILVRLRDELQRQADDQGKHLRFPRFDLGALIAQALSSTEDLAALEPHKIQEKLANGTQLIESLGALGSSLGLTLPVIGPLVAGLKLAPATPGGTRQLGFPGSAHGLDVVSPARHGDGAGGRGDDEGGPAPLAGVESARHAGT